jgi:hypothetical protein
MGSRCASLALVAYLPRQGSNRPGRVPSEFGVRYDQESESGGEERFCRPYRSILWMPPLFLLRSLFVECVSVRFDVFCSNTGICQCSVSGSFWVVAMLVLCWLCSVVSPCRTPASALRRSVRAAGLGVTASAAEPVLCSRDCVFVHESLSPA